METLKNIGYGILGIIVLCLILLFIGFLIEVYPKITSLICIVIGGSLGLYHLGLMIRGK